MLKKIIIAGLIFIFLYTTSLFTYYNKTVSSLDSHKIYTEIINPFQKNDDVSMWIDFSFEADDSNYYAGYYDSYGRIEDISKLRLNDKNRTNLRCLAEYTEIYKSIKYCNAEIEIKKYYKSDFNEKSKEWNTFELTMTEIKYFIDSELVDGKGFFHALGFPYYN